MRTRRTHFATPFVLVAVAGCPKSTHSNPPGPAANPPPPKLMSIDDCKAVQVGATCSYEYGECSIGPEDIHCGLQGYDCKETAPGTFTWTETKLACPPAAAEPAT